MNQQRYTAFRGHNHLATGDLRTVLGEIVESGGEVDQSGGPLLCFDNESGTTIDFDLRGSLDEIVARARASLGAGEGSEPGGPSTPDAKESSESGKGEPDPEGGTAAGGGSARRGPGRPRLGVVSREISLLPRQWDWLGSQPRGASATLRRLVDDARKSGSREDLVKRRIDAAGRFIWAIAGNLAGFEEASRALYARRWDDLDRHTSSWPADLRRHLELMLAPAERRPAD